MFALIHLIVICTNRMLRTPFSLIWDYHTLKDDCTSFELI